MRKFSYNFLPALILPLLIVPLVCFTSHAAPTPVKNPVPKKAKQTASPPVHMGVVERTVVMELPDPKHPGKLMCHVAAVSLQGQSADKGLLGTLTQVQAELYQLGKPAATMAAPRVDGKQTTKTVILTATGGVVMHSLVQSGTLLTADKVVWYARSNQITATGHVFYRDGKTGMTLHVPKLVADTRLHSLDSAGAGYGSAIF